MDRLKNIVVGVDFSKYSQNALAQAIRLAHWNEAKLHVAHVIEPTLTTNLAEAYGAPGVDTWSGFRDIARERISRMIATAREATTPAGATEPLEVDLSIEVLFGNPFAHLLCEVRDVSAELLVLGSNGVSEPSEGPGVLATKCVRRSPTKVLVVCGHGAEPFGRVVACVRFSDTCRAVVEQAIRVARQDNSALRILHVYSPSSETVEGVTSAAEASAAWRQASEKRIEACLQKLLPPFGPAMDGLTVETHFAETGGEKAGLIDFVRSSGADLVVLATRGRTGLEAKPVATTAERIMREASCSVLALKKEAFKHDVVGEARRC